MAISLHESITLGFIDFWSRKVRSFITLLGIVLGTMSIIVILSIVNGMNEMSLSWMNESGGIRKMNIYRNWRYQSQTNLPSYFTLREIEFIKENLPPVDAFNVAIGNWLQLSNGQNSTQCYAQGTMPDFTKTEQWAVSEGRFFNQHDYMESNDVIVIGTTLKDRLFGPRNAIGQYVTVRGKRMMVIGIMAHRSMPGNRWSQNPLEWLNQQAFMPVSTMVNKLGVPETISEIAIQCFDEKQPYIVKPILEDMLLNMRKGQPIFRVESAIEDVAKMQEDTKMFRIIFFFISTISLFVGGIVIMNIMLATIQERTREIGIRLAVGARQIDIFVQFLVQTVVVTFIGGTLGVLSAFTIVDAVGNYLEMSTKSDVSMVVVALCVSCVIGLFFGIYPAIKASKLDPVIALRNE